MDEATVKYLIGLHKVADMSPEDAYRLGAAHGRSDALDRHYGTPCEAIRHAQEVGRLRGLIATAAEDLRGYIEAEYPAESRAQYPLYERRFRNSIEFVETLEAESPTPTKAPKESE